MLYLKVALVLGVLGLMIATTMPRVKRARRRGHAKRARRFWAAYEYAWAIVYGRRKFKRLPYFERIEEPVE